MHELGLSRNIVAIVSENAGARAVKRVALAVGNQACVEVEALKFCFDIARQNTVLARAELEILNIEGDDFLIREFEFEGEA